MSYRPPPKERVRAIVVMARILSDGPMPGKDVRARMMESGFAPLTIRHARLDLGVRMETKHWQGQSMWSLPRGAPKIIALDPF